MGLPPTLFEMGRLRQRYLWNYLPHKRRLATWFKENKIQLVVANSFPAGKLGFPAAYDAGIPAILYKQIIIHKSRFSSTAAIYRFYLRRCDRIIAVSEACRRGLVEIGIPEKIIVVIPNGVDTEKWKPGVEGNAFRKSFGIEETALLVGTVAVPRPEKGIEVLLQAWAEVVNKHSPARLAIVGAPEPSQQAYGQTLRSVCRSLGIDGSVVFCGYLQDLQPAYGAFDLFVSSSHSEAFGLSLAAAMACGKPVVSTRSGGPDEIVEDGVSGCLCLPGDPVALSKAILGMIADGDKRNEMGRAARKRIADRFSLDRQIQSLEKLFCEVAGNG
jgi:glycosyltransferase involved in cell wall biosynthesis